MKQTNRRVFMMTLAAGTSALATAAMAQASGEGPWMVRARAVHLDMANKDGTGLGLSVNNKTIPEVDETYREHVTTELANMTPGKTRNPQNLERSPGGSSSGSAAAVAAGMVMAAQLSVAAGDMSAEELQRTETLIEACGLPTRPPADMTSEDFLQLMVRDKKVLDGQLRLVLLKGIGHGFVGADFDMNLLQQILADACSD